MQDQHFFTVRMNDLISASIHGKMELYEGLNKKKKEVSLRSECSPIGCIFLHLYVDIAALASFLS